MLRVPLRCEQYWQQAGIPGTTSMGSSHLNRTRSSAKLQALIRDKLLQQAHLQTIKQSPLGRDVPPTYWADLSSFLGLRW